MYKTVLLLLHGINNSEGKVGEKKQEACHLSGIRNIMVIISLYHI